jgi:hypothetical protein
MDSEILRILSEELRETKNLVAEARVLSEQAKIEAAAAVKKADAAWELVIITRNQVLEELRYMKLPLWRKLIGATS